MEWTRGRLVIGLLMGWLVLSAEVMQSEGQVGCGTVAVNIAGCLGYVTGGAKPTSTSPCCTGVKKLDGLAATSVTNRRAICRCLQSSAASIKPIPSAVAALPGICGATHPYSLSENCATLP